MNWHIGRPLLCLCKITRVGQRQMQQLASHFPHDSRNPWWRIIAHLNCFVSLEITVAAIVCECVRVNVFLHYHCRIAVITVWQLCCRLDLLHHDYLLLVVDVDAGSDGNNVDFMQSFSKLRDVSSIQYVGTWNVTATDGQWRFSDRYD